MINSKNFTIIASNVDRYDFKKMITTDIEGKFLYFFFSLINDKNKV